MHRLSRLFSPLRVNRPRREHLLLSRKRKHSLKDSREKIGPHADGTLSIEPSVQRALDDGRPVVALESTIISHGMPYPENLAMARYCMRIITPQTASSLLTGKVAHLVNLTMTQLLTPLLVYHPAESSKAARGCLSPPEGSVEDIIRSRGATPATVAILAGRPHVGLTPVQLEELAMAGPRARKCSRCDLAVAMAQGADGATTVASTAFLASLAGISVFVTGGMGGVHRGAETTFDVSADLAELAQTPIVVVCAGVKSILDIEKTLEVLETNGVPVVAYGTDVFPAFFSPSSGVPAPLRMDTPSEVAAAARAGFELGMRNGMVVAVPNPSPMVEGAEVDAAIRLALEEAEERGLTGRDVTPFLLARVNKTTGGQSLKSNVALVRNNAEVGADIAVELAALPGKTSDPSRRTPPMPMPGTRQQLRPRVAIFGGAVVDTVSRPEPGCALTPGTSTPGETRRSFGGVGRNVAEGLTRLLLSSSGQPDGKEAGENGEGNGSDSGAEITLVATVGADDAGRALVNACEEAGVCARETVEEAVDISTGTGTASYVAVLGGDGDLVAAVADMRVMERMTPDFVNRHSGVIDRAGIVVADGNLPPGGFARVARLCVQKRVPLVFEPTSVAKCSVPFKAEAAGCIALATPNVDELIAMSLAAGDGALGLNSGAEPGLKNSHEKCARNLLEAEAVGSGRECSGMRVGHSLQQAAIENGHLVDPRPFGSPLKTVLAAMLGAGEPHVSEQMTGCSTMQPLVNGGRHVVVTMGSAGILLATACLASSTPRSETAVVREGNALLEIPSGSGRLFSLSAKHYPALPLEGLGGEGIIVNCTGAGDCLVAGMVGGFALGWGTHESLCLGLLCARQSVMAEQAVPGSLGELLPRGHAYNYGDNGDGSRTTSSWSARGFLMQLPKDYEPTVVYPWQA